MLLRVSCSLNNQQCPQIVDDLANFEQDLYNMIKNIEFKFVSNNFQRQLTDDIKAINNSDKVFVSADKSRNIYKMDKEQYTKLINENIAKAYRKTNKNSVNKINKDAKKIAKSLSTDGRVEKIQESQTYITVKDHKDK